jgi:hypothetical protein
MVFILHCYCRHPSKRPIIHDPSRQFDKWQPAYGDPRLNGKEHVLFIVASLGKVIWLKKHYHTDASSLCSVLI